jgi:hypothetical protein
MRDAAIPGYRLWKAKRSTRVLISLALGGLTLALFTSVALTLVKTGLTPESVTTYYRGSASADLDGLLVAASPRPFAELLEVTHLHLMGGSILLFLLCHLLSLCEISERVRTALYLGSFSSFLLTFTLPWGIIYIHPAFAWAFAPAVLVLVVTLATLMIIPLFEMWRGGRHTVPAR